MSNKLYNNYSRNFNTYSNYSRNITKIYLFDINKKEIIFTKYDIYFVKDNQGNRRYYSCENNSPLFQSIEMVDEYKKLNLQVS